MRSADLDVARLTGSTCRSGLPFSRGVEARQCLALFLLTPPAASPSTRRDARRAHGRHLPRGRGRARPLPRRGRRAAGGAAPRLRVGHRELDDRSSRRCKAAPRDRARSQGLRLDRPAGERLLAQGAGAAGEGGARRARASGRRPSSRTPGARRWRWPSRSSTPTRSAGWCSTTRGSTSRSSRRCSSSRGRTGWASSLFGAFYDQRPDERIGAGLLRQGRRCPRRWSRTSSARWSGRAPRRRRSRRCGACATTRSRAATAR